jgi:hypothetical protein
MKKVMILIGLQLLVSSSGIAASRTYYDVKRLKVILENRDLVAKMEALQFGGGVFENIRGMRLVGEKVIAYEITSSSCKNTVELTWTDDEQGEPEYRVISVGDFICE